MEGQTALQTIHQNQEKQIWHQGFFFCVPEIQHGKDTHMIFKSTMAGIEVWMLLVQAVMGSLNLNKL